MCFHTPVHKTVEPIEVPKFGCHASDAVVTRWLLSEVREAQDEITALLRRCDIEDETVQNYLEDARWRLNIRSAALAGFMASTGTK